MESDNRFRDELFELVDGLSEYYDDIVPEDSDTVEDLLEKYFWWVTERNDGYSNELENPEESEFNAWLAAKAPAYM